MKRNERLSLPFRALSVVLALAIAGCATPPRIEDENLREAAKYLNVAERHVEEWGTATVSELFIVKDVGQYKIDYDGKTGDYINKARAGLQGSAARSFERAFDSRTSVQQSFDAGETLEFLNASLDFVERLQTMFPVTPEAAAASAASGLANAAGKAASAAGAMALGLDPNTGVMVHDFVSKATKQDDDPNGTEGEEEGEEEGEGDDGGDGGDGGDTEGEDPGTATTGEDKPAFLSILDIPNHAQGVLSSEQFSEPLGIGDLPSEIAERRALLIGVNDKITENLLKALVHPQQVPDNKQIYIGTFQVSCNPGWRTSKGYVADLNVTAEYAKYDPIVDDNRYSSQEPFAPRPSIISIFPNLEAQTLDLRNSERDQIALMMHMSATFMAAGAKKQAQNLSSFARRLQLDVATRSPIPVVSSYSDGTNFGFQFTPALQALEDPSDRTKGSAHVLHPYSFPALVVFACEKQDLKSIAEGGQGWDRIALTSNARWIPQMKNKTRIKRPFTKRLTPGQRIRVAHAIDIARDSYGSSLALNAYGYEGEDSEYERSALATELDTLNRTEQSLTATLTRLPSTVGTQNDSDASIESFSKKTSRFGGGGGIGTPAIGPTYTNLRDVLQGEVNEIAGRRRTIQNRLDSMGDYGGLATHDNAAEASQSVAAQLQTVENVLKDRLKITSTKLAALEKEYTTLATPKTKGASSPPDSDELKKLKAYKEEQRKQRLAELFPKIEKATDQVKQIKQELTFLEKEIINARTQAEELSHGLRPGESYAQLAAYSRLSELTSLARDKTVISMLPVYTPPKKADKPTVAAVFPETGWVNANSVFLIQGTGFAEGNNKIVQSVTIGGRLCSYETLSDKVIAAALPGLPSIAPGDSIPGEVIVATKRGVGQATTPVNFKFKSPEVPDPTIELEYSGDKLKKIILDPNGGVTGLALLEAIRHILASHGGDIDIALEVKGGTKISKN